MISESDKLRMVELYNMGMGAPRISIEFDTSRENVTRILKSLGVVMRTPYDIGKAKAIRVNHDFFQVIDSEIKAYLLGIMFSDGHVDTARSRIGTSMTDYDVVEIFRDAVCPNSKIHSMKVAEGGKQIYRVQASSDQLKVDLISHGCTPNKSLTVGAPVGVPQHLERHFIRGYFDGDGHVIMTDKRYAEFGFTGTKEMMVWIHGALCDAGISMKKPYLRDKNHPEKNTYKTTAYNKGAMLAIRDYMYCDAHYYMQRKYDKFQQIYSWYRE